VKRLAKVAIAGLGVTLILIAVVLLVVSARLDILTKAGLELRLSYIFMADVTVGEVDVSLLRQTIDIRDLTVSNPADFRKGTAMELGRVAVRYDGRSFFSITPTVKKVKVEDAQIHLRYELGDGTNLGRLVENVSQLESAEEGKSGRGEVNNPAWSAVAEPSGLRRTLVVEEYACQGAKVRLSTNLIPLSSMSLTIAPFRLCELTAGKPVSIPRLALIFVRSVMIETLSLDGLLSPVGKLLRKEVDAGR